MLEILKHLDGITAKDILRHGLYVPCQVIFEISISEEISLRDVN
jgi:hypothetical protein